jgi:hypothetical protein
MYAVHTMYPRTEGVSFDKEWWLDVHSPLGLGLLLKRCGVRPIENFYTHNTVGMDRTEGSSDFFVLSTMKVKTKEEAEAFIDLFEMTKEAEMLSADWDNYTGAPPVCVLGEFTQTDLDAVYEKSDEAIERASAEWEAGAASS